MYITVESSNEVIKCLISDVMWLLMVWSNQNAALSNECVRSSALFLPTAFLHCARENNQFDHVRFMSITNGKVYSVQVCSVPPEFQSDTSTLH